MRILAPLLALPLVACTLHVTGDDSAPDPGDDTVTPPDPNPDPDPTPTGERLIIGSQPHVNAEHLDWADIWLNYPALDCEAINLYGAQIPVVVDARYDEFVTASGAVVGGSDLVLGWLSLERDRPDQLWRVTAWEPEAGGTQPACYHW